MMKDFPREGDVWESVVLGVVKGGDICSSARSKVRVRTREGGSELGQITVLVRCLAENVITRLSYTDGGKVKVAVEWVGGHMGGEGLLESSLTRPLQAAVNLQAFPNHTLNIIVILRGFGANKKFSSSEIFAAAFNTASVAIFSAVPPSQMPRHTSELRTNSASGKVGSRKPKHLLVASFNASHAFVYRVPVHSSKASQDIAATLIAAIALEAETLGRIPARLGSVEGPTRCFLAESMARQILCVYGKSQASMANVAKANDLG